MKKTFDSAEELMEHLKSQIIQYSGGDERINNVINSRQLADEVDLSRFKSEIDSNNKTWNTSVDRPITSHRKVIGKFIVFGKKVVRKLLKWYVSKGFEQQTSFNGSVTRSFNELYNVIIQLNARQQGYEATLNNKNEYILNMQEHITQLTKKLQKNESLVRDIDRKTDEIDNRLSSLLLEVRESALKVEEIERSKEDSPILEKIKQIEEELKFLQYRARQQKKISSSNLVTTEYEIKVNTNSVTTPSNFDYLYFENKFRGSVDEIKKRQRAYLPYFLEKENVLDIGCGRGEFVELLLEHKIPIRGVDSNRDMVEYCQDRGLPVEFEDGINYLYTIEDNSLDGIFLGQVIEHLTFDQICKLVELAYNKLKAGSYLVMETPNPLSLAIFYRTFYVDPTHIKPVHPLTIQFVVNSAGFKNSEIKYSSRVESNWFLPKLEASTDSIKNIDQYNEGVERINDMLYGYLDYAIIAQK